MVNYKCYIEEYYNENGKLCARLRDKETDKKIDIVSKVDIKAHLLRFLSSAKMNIDVMPTVFNRDGEDIVVVQGIDPRITDDRITLTIDDMNGGYWFE